VNISRPFIQRPVMTTLIMAAILIFGILSFRTLPVNDLPNVDFPTITVSAVLPGASPDTMAAAVATPLERQFSTIDGLDSMSSMNFLGISQITLQFSLKKDLNAAALDVQAAISRAEAQLPPEMPSPPSFQKVNPASSPILFIALTSPTLPLSTLDEYAETFMAERISMVSGVAQVLVFGSQKYAVRIQLDPDRLASTGIGIDEAAQAVQRGNVNLPTGTLYGPKWQYTIESNGQLFNAASYRDLIVAYRNGSPVRVKDIGQAVDSVENDKVAAWFFTKQGPQRSVVLAIQRQPGTNTVRVASDVRELLPVFRGQIPASANFQVLYDRSLSIKESVNDVEFTLVLAVILVILVIFFFLRNLTATVIPSLALPFSIVGTFAVMEIAGFSLNNLTLMALTLSIGFLVDDAIVMLENIFRHQEMGATPLEATLKGSQEIAFTIVSMTLSLAAIFIPILFMAGIVGRLFREFAVTIGAAVLFSGFVSLTLTPMISSRILRPVREVRHGRLYLAVEAFLRNTLEAYKKGLRWSLGHRLPLLLFSLVSLLVTIFLFMKIPKGFLPSEDTGQFIAVTEAIQGISFEAISEHQLAVANVVIKDPNVATLITAVGGGFAAPNQGRMFAQTQPRAKRKLGVNQIIGELRPQLGRIPGIFSYLQNPPPIQIGGRFTQALYQFTLQSPDTAVLYAKASDFLERVRALPILLDVSSDMQLRNPQVTVKVDRDKAEALGVTPQQVEDALYYAYGQRQISTIYAPNNEYQVIMELEPQQRTSPADLSKLYIRSSTGALVPLSAVGTLVPTLGPLSVNHSGQLPSVTISFNLKPGVAIGDAVTQITNLARTELPATISASFQGTAQAFQASLQGMGFLLLLTIFIIYMILGILYESFIHPLTILSALPFAGFGALLTLMVFRTELTIYAYVGIIMLVGLVKKNGIIMIDFALAAERKEGKSASESIFEACVVRFRPIMMTTMATLFGTLPIAMGFGAGAESRRPLGLAVVGGLLFSQLITLFVTPVIYTYLDELKAGFGKRKQATPASSDVDRKLAE
jgi:hydrophobic/amphiphilic exporter-1 (mainly G- bacteria), HAE1 family